MPVMIVDDESVAKGIVTDNTKCEQCKTWILNSRLCYCESCDIIVCVYCVYKSHNGTDTMPSHPVFWRDGMAQVNPEDLVKCANLRCRDFKYEHEAGELNCTICESAVAKHQTKEEADLLRCHDFIDERALSDDQKFWMSFDFACGVIVGRVKLAKGEQPPAPYTTRETLHYAAIIRHWRWSAAKVERMLKKSMSEGKIVEVPESIYHRAPKSSKVLVKVEKNC